MHQNICNMKGKCSDDTYCVTMNLTARSAPNRWFLIKTHNRFLSDNVPCLVKDQHKRRTYRTKQWKMGRWTSQILQLINVQSPFPGELRIQRVHASRDQNNYSGSFFVHEWEWLCRCWKGTTSNSNVPKVKLLNTKYICNFLGNKQGKHCKEKVKSRASH